MNGHSVSSKIHILYKSFFQFGQPLALNHCAQILFVISQHRIIVKYHTRSERQEGNRETETFRIPETPLFAAFISVITYLQPLFGKKIVDPQPVI